MIETAGTGVKKNSLSDLAGLEGSAETVAADASPRPVQEPPFFACRPFEPIAAGAFSRRKVAGETLSPRPGSAFSPDLPAEPRRGGKRALNSGGMPPAGWDDPCPDTFLATGFLGSSGR